MNRIIYIFLFISSSCFSQDISNSVLETFDYEFPSSFELKQRNYPEPYYDSVKKQDIYPPYTDPKTGVVYEYQEPYVDRDPYTGQYLDCIDDKILPIGWSEDGKFYYSIYNYSYGEWDLLRGKIEYILIDVKNNKLIHYDTIENKNIIIDHNINLKAELEQFPLKIHDTNGSLIEEININNYRLDIQKLAFSSTKRGEVVIKDSIDPHQLEGCPDEVKGYFLSPDKKHLIAVFYSNFHITGAGGDLCEGSIYFKTLDIESFKILPENIDSNVVLSNYIFDPDEKNILSNILSDSSINKLAQTLITLHNTDSDWEVIQSFIEIAAVKDSFDLVDDFDEDYGGIAEFIGFQSCNLPYSECGCVIYFNEELQKFVTKTNGTADDDFLKLLSAHSDENLYNNNNFIRAATAGAMDYRTWELGSGSFLNYFKIEADFKTKYHLYDKSFHALNVESAKGLRKMIDRIHDDAIDYLFYDPRKKNYLEIGYKGAIIEELNQILDAKVLNESENDELKAHIEDLENDTTPWLEFSFDDE